MFDELCHVKFAGSLIQGNDDFVEEFNDVAGEAGLRGFRDAEPEAEGVAEVMHGGEDVLFVVDVEDGALPEVEDGEGFDDEDEMVEVAHVL